MWPEKLCAIMALAGVSLLTGCTVLAAVFTVHRQRKQGRSEKLTSEHLTDCKHSLGNLNL